MDQAVRKFSISGKKIQCLGSQNPRDPEVLDDLVTSTTSLGTADTTGSVKLKEEEEEHDQTWTNFLNPFSSADPSSQGDSGGNEASDSSSDPGPMSFPKATVASSEKSRQVGACHTVIVIGCL